ncbi:hypothetical protein [Microvirga ossetica]|nr:hypothetical protein [Microvirga ossetica]
MLAELRLGQLSELQCRDTELAFDVQEREFEVEHLWAQIDAAERKLD